MSANFPGFPAETFDWKMDYRSVVLDAGASCTAVNDHRNAEVAFWDARIIEKTSEVPLAEGSMMRLKSRVDDTEYFPPSDFRRLQLFMTVNTEFVQRRSLLSCLRMSKQRPHRPLVDDPT